MLRKISHILIAFVVLITTMGLTVSVHSCCGELKSIHLLSKAKSCCGDSCPNCENEIIKVGTGNDFTIPMINFDFTQDFSFLPVLIQLFLLPVFTEELVQVAYHEPPPLKIQTVLSDLQVYRL